ncbi:LysM peptidoglycan-binding domain-containing protein [Microbacterium sp. 2216-1]|uniref:LysM peptidoglycan-binding domain-containing protein n=1 Tax=Microbacterium sp. 2216-1 TaxID=3390053 RepID=UPI00397640E5
MQRLYLASAALVIAAVALVGCSPTAEPDAAPAASRSTQPTTAPADTASEDKQGTCGEPARIAFRGVDGEPKAAEFLGDLVDSGSTDGATGSLSENAAGEVAYTVAPKDSIFVLADRFCVDLDSVMRFNHLESPTIHPDQVLVLRPADGSVWTPEP